MRSREPKPWWRSRTIRFNAIVAAMAAIEANAHLIQPYLPGSVYGWGMMFLVCGNAVLRLLTAQGVCLK